MKKNCKLFLISLGAATAMMLLMTYLFGINYYIVDDALINYYTEGMYGIGYNQICIPYIGVVVTGIIYLAEQIFQDINWYLVYLYGSVLILATIWHFLFFIKKKPMYSHAFILFFQMLTYTLLTYTVIAYLWCFTGFLLGVSARDSKHKNIYYVFAVIAEILGISTREDVWVTTFMLCVPFLIYELWKRKQKTVLGIMLVSGILFISIHLLNTGVRNMSSIEKEYLEWNSASTKIRDFSQIPYEGHETEYEQLGLTENDVEFLNTWMFADKERFDTETLEQIANMRSVTDTYNLNPFSIITQFVQNKFFVFFAAGAIALFVLLRWKSIFTWGTVGMFFLMLIALIIRQRVVDRVFVPMMIITSLIMLFYCKDFFEPRILKQNILFRQVIVYIVVAILFLQIGQSNYKASKSEMPQNMELYSYTQEHQDKLFVCSSFGMMYQIQENICKFFPEKEDYLTNLVTWGDWGTFSSQYYSLMEKYNVQSPDNIFRALLEENVYLFSNDQNKINILTEYYRQKFNNKIVIQIEKKYSNGNVYKITVDEVETK